VSKKRGSNWGSGGSTEGSFMVIAFATSNSMETHLLVRYSHDRFLHKRLTKETKNYTEGGMRDLNN
jgi:hypothetical protein